MEAFLGIFIFIFVLILSAYIISLPFYIMSSPAEQFEEDKQGNIIRRRGESKINRRERSIKETIDKLKEDPPLLLAFKKRLGDTGWGWATAHIVPFVGIYYAFSRRTVTPFLYSYLAALGISITCGFLFGSNIFAVTASQLLIFCLEPLLAKLGIDQAREYAKQCLKKAENLTASIEEGSTETFDDQKVTRQSLPLQTSPVNREIIKKEELDEMESSLKKLKEMRESGLISEEEYQAMRKKNLGL